MALAPSITTAARNAAADAVVDLVDVGGTGTLRIYDGTAPADANAALSGNTLLAQLTMSATAFGTAAAGVATAAAITQDSSADATGTATFFRILSGAGTPLVIMQGSVGTATADLVLNSVAISSGAAVSVSSLTYTQAGS
jgi:hypothetical protein